MKETDLSVYFSPCPYMEAANFFADDTLRLGRTVEKYTVESIFPSIEGAKVAIVGLYESRGVDNENPPDNLNAEDLVCNGADAVRKQLYNLYPARFNGKIVDLGNLKPGKTIEDTYFAVDEVVHTLVGQGTVVILLGGTQDITCAVYRAYIRMHKPVNILAVDARLNLAEGVDSEESLISSPPSHNSYMSRIAVMPENYLFNHINLGYQTYLVEPDAVTLMNRLSFDACRLGLLRGNIQEAEPYVRDTDVLSFDLCSVKRGESPANPWALPTGFTAEEACQIFRYAGMTHGLEVVGLFEYYPSLDRDNLSCLLQAEMIWCFLDAMQHRINDCPGMNAEVEHKEYIVPMEESGREVVFYKCKQTDRWWMKLPCNEQQMRQYGRHCFMPCSYSDYQSAMAGEISPRWWRALQRLN